MGVGCDPSAIRGFKMNHEEADHMIYCSAVRIVKKQLPETRRFLCFCLSLSRCPSSFRCEEHYHNMGSAQRCCADRRSPLPVDYMIPGNHTHLMSKEAGYEVDSVLGYDK